MSTSFLFRPRPAWVALAGLGGSLAAFAQSPADPPAAATAPAPAPVQAPALERVEITGTAVPDTAVRRESTAAKTVIGREELDRMGDSAVSEVIRRLPGVTTGGRPGRGGGSPRMRGMGSGYTQILVNGERLSAGLSLDDLSPDQVERIEVYKAPTAETGAQAVAGTINIVLREDVRKRLNQFTLTETDDDGRWQHSLGWTRADQLGDFSYSVNGQLNRSDRDTVGATRTVTTSTDTGSGQTTTDQDLLDQRFSRDRRLSLHAGARLNWRLDGGDSLTLNPFGIVSQGDGRNRSVRSDAVTGTPPLYDTSRGTSDSAYRLLRLNGQWTGRLDGGGRLELRGGGSLSRYDLDNDRVESAGGDDNRRQTDLVDIRERWWSTGGKFSRALNSDHQLAIGWELERGQRDDRRDSRQGPPAGPLDPVFTDFGDDLQARTLRAAAWAQDEWALDGQWSLHGGLRWEGITTHSDTPDAPVDNRSSVLSPLLHALYRLEEGGRDQVRLSLTRSYRAPTLQNLAARPSINRLAPVTAPNRVTQPDRAGNPGLEPELATGLDLALERYLDTGGVFSVGAFHRRIEQLIRNVTALETVSWSSAQRYVSRPQNVGNATTTGLELEAKFRLDEALAQATPVELRGNLAVFRSRVEGIAGPDNRIDQQPGWTANLGFDHRLRSLPLKFGSNIGWTPGYAVQQTDTLRTETAGRRVLDAYVAWSFSPAVQLRLSGSNLAPRDLVGQTQTIDASGNPVVQELSTDTEPSLRVWALRLEVRL